MIESILALFAVGTFWFWLLIGIVSIIFIASIENDHYATPTIAAILCAALFWKPIMALSWQAVAITLAIYALGGVIWSLFKWYRFVQKKARYYHEKFGNTMSPSQHSELRSAVSVSENKARLTGWIAWWPWSLIWSLTGDFFNFLYDTMVNAYQKIADKALGKFAVTPETNNKEIITDSERGHNYARGRRQV